jgi:1,4-dihydroxy-2-naphthoate octaprenyltransferase
MNTVTQAWIGAARLRTLPLSISGILVGSSYAYLELAFAKAQFPQDLLEIIGLKQEFNWWIPVLALITTLGLQVLSNFANDYGDGVKGTDNDERIGPMRAIQSGIIAPAQMKKVIIITSILTFICAVALIYVSLGVEEVLISLFFLVLGIAAIWAAIKYTVGDNAYGYKGLGDLFVFIFFGPVGILGTHYLILKDFNIQLVLPSITIGLLSVAVLNLNNMRDLESDRKVGKNTIPVKVGLAKAKIIHYFILITALVCMLGFTWSNWELASSIYEVAYVLFLPMLAFIPLLFHLRVVANNKSPLLLDPELKKVALSTFLLALLCMVSILIVIDL